jgi:hypothetical protein
MMISPYIRSCLDEIDEAIKNPEDYEISGSAGDYEPSGGARWAVPSPSYPVWRAYGNIHPDSAYVPEPAPVSAGTYRAFCLAAWRKRNNNFKTALSYFRRWKANYGPDGNIASCTFQIRKDGANYENIPLPLYKNSLPVLRLFATIFNVPYRHNLKREELLEILGHILHCLSYPPYPWNRRR